MRGCAGPSRRRRWRGQGGAPGDLGRLAGLHGGHWAVLTGCRKGGAAGPCRGRTGAAEVQLDRLVQAFGRDNVFVELWDHGDPLDSARNDALVRLADRVRVEVVATSNVHYATRDVAGWPPRWPRSGPAAPWPTWTAGCPPGPARTSGPGSSRRPVWPATRARSSWPPSSAGPWPSTWSWSRPACPTSRSCRAHRDDLAARAGHPGRDPPLRPPARRADPGAWRQIDHELAMIEQLGFPGYFLIVWDLVEFCRRSDIYCQGRGSAANSAVCYAIGITKADAVSLGLLFERFLSPSATGRPTSTWTSRPAGARRSSSTSMRATAANRAAQVANVVTYQARSAVRDMGRALGYAPGQLDAWSKQVDAWGPIEATIEHEIPEQVMELARQVQRFPRHLGIHSGGMVICDRPVVEVCPVEWATMKDRSVLQWDKDDCAAVGLVKFDLLGLGMLGPARHRRPGQPLPRGRGRPGRAAPGGRRLRDAVRGRLGRGVPGREPGPDTPCRGSSRGSSTTWSWRWP